VTAAGNNIVGVILLQELPHLSHLGVKARQCVTEALLAVIVYLSRFNIVQSLDASPSGVNVSHYSVKDSVRDSLVETSSNGIPTDSVSKSIRSSQGVSTSDIIPLADADVQTSGAKAASCGTLASLAAVSAKVKNDQGVPASFNVPNGAVIPFGTMELAIKENKSTEAFESLLEQIETAKLDGGELDKLCNELQNLITTVRLPNQIIQSLGKLFENNARLIVRSSANVRRFSRECQLRAIRFKFPNVNISNPDILEDALVGCGLVIHPKRGFKPKIAGVPHKAASWRFWFRNVSPDLSFVLSLSAQRIMTDLARGTLRALWVRPESGMLDVCIAFVAEFGRGTYSHVAAISSFCFLVYCNFVSIAMHSAAQPYLATCSSLQYRAFYPFGVYLSSFA
ncbi:phosphoglucan, water dikinase, chloroplastic, partial [Tanacetum coccineum]